MKILIFAFLFLTTHLTHAATLQDLARTSNALLALSNRLSTGAADQKDACGWDHSKISELSQNLKSEIDAKIESLTANDLKIIEKRASSCQADCTCDIYALALETKKQPNEVINSNAAKLKQTHREICFKAYKSICTSPYLKN